MSELILRKSISINAPAQKVWEVMTQLTYLAQWQYIPASATDDKDLHAGSAMQWRDENNNVYLEGTVTVFEPHKTLTMDLRDTRWKKPLEPGAISQTFTLEENDGITTLKFTFGDFNKDPDGKAWYEAFRDNNELEDIKKMAEATQPHEKLTALDVLIGTWDVKDPESGDISGTVRFEWMEGGFFLQQHVDFTQGGQHIKGLEIIGYDNERDVLSTHYFDNSGHNFTYDWEFDGVKLTIWFKQKGSNNFFTGIYDPEEQTLEGDWQWPGGGYHSKMKRVHKEEK